MAEAKKVLIVDDDPSIRQFLKDCLEEHHFIVHDSPGEQAGTIAPKCKNYDLIILDMLMPMYDGFQILTEIREVEPTLPVLIVTGFITHDLTKQARTFQYVSFLSKPVTVEDLISAINQIL